MEVIQKITFISIASTLTQRQSFLETFFALLGVTVLKLIFDYTPPKDF